MVSFDSYLTRSRFVTHIKARNNSQGIEKENREILAWLEYPFGRTDTHCVIARLDLASSLRNTGCLIEAEAATPEILHTMETSRDLLRRTPFAHQEALSLLYYCQYDMTVATSMQLK